MNPLIDVLATIGGSIVLAAFFLWLLTTAASQEKDGLKPHGRTIDPRGGRAHG